MSIPVWAPAPLRDVNTSAVVHLMPVYSASFNTHHATENILLCKMSPLSCQLCQTYLAHFTKDSMGCKHCGCGPITRSMSVCGDWLQSDMCSLTLIYYSLVALPIHIILLDWTSGYQNLFLTQPGHWFAEENCYLAIIHIYLMQNIFRVEKLYKM